MRNRWILVRVFLSVKALSSVEVQIGNKYYPGVAKRVNVDGTYVVNFDNGDKKPNVTIFIIYLLPSSFYYFHQMTQTVEKEKKRGPKGPYSLLLLSPFLCLLSPRVQFAFFLTPTSS